MIFPYDLGIDQRTVLGTDTRDILVATEYSLGFNKAYTEILVVNINFQLIKQSMDKINIAFSLLLPICSSSKQIVGKY